MTEDMVVEAGKLSTTTRMNYDQAMRYVIDKAYMTGEEIEVAESMSSLSSSWSISGERQRMPRRIN